jgi:plasmid segregation protein ParM
MHAAFHIFPSVVETAPPALDLKPGPLLEQLIVTDRGQQALVGDLALSEGRSPGRMVNASPDQRDYRLLLKAAVLVATHGRSGAFSIGTGFPMATLRSNAEAATVLLSRLESIGFDARPLGGPSAERMAVKVANVSVTSEIAACDIALREGPTRSTGSHFLISLGYGTCEAALSTPTGIVQRTAVSLAGVRYAIERAMQDVARTTPLGLRTEHQFDAHFRTGRITVGREKLSLLDVRRRALDAYMENVIVPAFANAWSAEEFDRADDLYVTGGGALYPSLMDAIRAEFGSALTVHAVPDPMCLAALGYALLAAREADKEHTSVGIDIGNANTCVCVLEP